MMIKRFGALAATVSLAVGLAACGGDDESGGTEIVLTDYAFTPGDVTFEPNTEVEVTLQNSGTVLHEWVILKPGVTISGSDELPETEAEILADFVFWEDEVQPARTRTRTFTTPPPGTYQIVCVIDDHFEQGMQGTLTVNA